MEGWRMWSSTGSSGILCVTAPNHDHASTLAPKRGHLIRRGKNKVWKRLKELTGGQEEGDMVVFVMLCQQLPQLPAATCPGVMPVGAQPSADRQLLIFHALLICPHVKPYPLYPWRWAAALWHTQASGLLPGLLWWPKSGYPRACSLGRVSCPTPPFFFIQ